MGGPTAFLDFQEFCISRARRGGGRDLLHFSITRNSVFLELGGEGRDLLHFSISKNSVIPERGGGGTYGGRR